MRRVPVPIAVALGMVVLVVAVTGLLNSFGGGLGHMPYVAAVWTVIALIGLAVYYIGRVAARQKRR